MQIEQLDAPLISAFLDHLERDLLLCRRQGSQLSRGAGPNDIQAIWLTHLREDHFGGTPFLILDAQARSQRRSGLPEVPAAVIAGR